MSITLIIGIGNPGKEYAHTYHNVGILFTDYCKSVHGGQELTPQELTVLASNTYVNDSGKFVAQVLKRTKTLSKHLLIVHDDSDIEIGKYKFTPPGHGSAGHHGIESIEAHLTTNNFWRLRIGIRPSVHTSTHRKKAGEFVLRAISPHDHALLEEVFRQALEELTQRISTASR